MCNDTYMIHGLSCFIIAPFRPLNTNINFPEAQLDPSWGKTTQWLAMARLSPMTLSMSIDVTSCIEPVTSNWLPKVHSWMR